MGLLEDSNRRSSPANVDASAGTRRSRNGLALLKAPLLVRLGETVQGYIDACHNFRCGTTGSSAGVFAGPSNGSGSAHFQLPGVLRRPCSRLSRMPRTIPV
jgi:hypothetical protein